MKSSPARVAVVVLGDIARSPRMMYHALSFAEPVACVYDPLAYAARGWSQYVRRFANGPRKVVFLDALPKTSSGKILKRALRRHGEIERGIDLKE